FRETRAAVWADTWAGALVGAAPPPATLAIAPAASFIPAALFSPPPIALFSTPVSPVLLPVIIRHLPAFGALRGRRRRPSPEEPPKDVRQLGDGGVGVARALLDGPGDAPARVIFQQDEAHLVQRRPRGRDLDEDVDAVL